jgi:hypothetical protein
MLTDRFGDDMGPAADLLWACIEQRTRQVEARVHSSLAPLREKLLRAASTASALYSFEQSRRKWARRVEQSEALLQMRLHETEMELAACRADNDRLREDLVEAKKESSCLQGSIGALRQQLHDSDIRQQTLDAAMARLEGSVGAAAVQRDGGSGCTSPTVALTTPRLSPQVAAVAGRSQPGTRSGAVLTGLGEGGRPPKAATTPYMSKSAALALYYECQSMLDSDSDDHMN